MIYNEGSLGKPEFPLLQPIFFFNIYNHTHIGMDTCDSSKEISYLNGIRSHLDKYQTGQDCKFPHLSFLSTSPHGSCSFLLLFLKKSTNYSVNSCLLFIIITLLPRLTKYLHLLPWLDSSIFWNFLPVIAIEIMLFYSRVVNYFDLCRAQKFKSQRATLFLIISS